MIILRIFLTTFCYFSLVLSIDWDIRKYEGIVYVFAYVDSQNSFGAMIRSDFSFIFKDGKAISFIFDGEEYIK